MLDLDQDPTEADYRQVYHVSGIPKDDSIENILKDTVVTISRDKFLFETGVLFQVDYPLYF